MSRSRQSSGFSGSAWKGARKTPVRTNLSFIGWFFRCIRVRYPSKSRAWCEAALHMSSIHSMNSAKSRIGTGDIEARGHPRLRSHGGEPRLAAAVNEEYDRYGWMWAVWRELVKQIILIALVIIHIIVSR